MLNKTAIVCLCSFFLALACDKKKNANGTDTEIPDSDSATDVDTSSTEPGPIDTMPDTTDTLGTLESDSPCADDDGCLEDQFCNDGTCLGRLTIGQKCQRDRECDPGLYCSFASIEGGRIVSKCRMRPYQSAKDAAESCTRDEDCFHNECSFYRSTCVAPCLDDSDCPAEAVCQPFDLWFGHSTSSCLPGCKSSSYCPVGYDCQDGRCVVPVKSDLGGPCVTTKDCKEGTCFARNLGICLEECNPGRCQDGYECVFIEEILKSNYCLPSCEADEDCRTAWSCHRDNEVDIKYCSEKCLHDGYCKDNEYCSDSGQCDFLSCVVHYDCQEDEICTYLWFDTNSDNIYDTVNTGCLPKVEGATREIGETCANWKQCKSAFCARSRDRCSKPCQTDDHCAAGYVCDRFAFEYRTTVSGCVPDCNVTPCPSGLICQASGRCTSENTDGFIQSPCVENSDCLHGYCRDFYGSSCYLECQTNPHVCPPGSICTGTSCTPTCKSHDDCRNFKKCLYSKTDAICQNYEIQLSGRVELINSPPLPPSQFPLPTWIDPKRVVVKWKEYSAAAKPSFRQIDGHRFRFYIKPSLHTNIGVLQFEKSFTTFPQLQSTLTALNDNKAVEYAEPLYLRRAHAVPSDPDYINQWWLQLLGCQSAWDSTTGSSELVVAVLDSGIVSAHPDLQERLVQGADLVSDINNSGDGHGRDLDPEDERYRGCGLSHVSLHGTSVAGIIGASANNDRFGAGIDWAARIQPVRVLGCEAGTSKDIADGIRWAAGLQVEGLPLNQTPAKIINLSLGGPGLSTVEYDAIKDAIAKGVIVVAAAGNDAGLVEAQSPAGMPNVISVAALERGKKRTIYSSHGDDVDIAAYGGDSYTDEDLDGLPDTVLTTDAFLSNGSIDFETNYFNGTSAAAPMVSGALSLMSAVYPDIDAATARWILKQTADPEIQCEKGCGAGALQIDRAIELAKEAAVNPAVLPDLVMSQDLFKAWYTDWTYNVLLANHAPGLSQFDITAQGSASEAIVVQDSIEILPNDTALLPFNVNALTELSGIHEAEIVITAPGVEERIRVVTHHGDWTLEAIPYFYVTAYAITNNGQSSEIYHLGTTSTDASLGYEFLLLLWETNAEIFARAYAALDRSAPFLFSGQPGERLLLTHSQAVENYNLSIGPAP